MIAHAPHAPHAPLRSVAVIPAKGRSRRLSGKNKRPLGGKPLFLYAVEAAQRGGVDEVRVSSDDAEILALAAAAGCTPVPRPPELATDHADLEHVKRHALRAVDSAYDAVLLLLPTYPFRSAADIRRALTVLASGMTWEVRSATAIERCGGLLLPNSYLSAYLVAAARARLNCPDVHLSTWIEIDRVRGTDIDDAEDWARAERLWPRFNFVSGAIASEADSPDPASSALGTSTVTTPLSASPFATTVRPAASRPAS